MRDRRRVDRVWGFAPVRSGNDAVAVAVARAGGTGVLDLGGDPEPVRAALARVERRWHGPFAARVTASTAIHAHELPAAVDTVMWARGIDDLAAAIAAWGRADRRFIVEVVSIEEAQAAAAAGADGLVAKGAEAGGRVGDNGAFVLLQQLLAAADADGTPEPPIWVQGGLGPATAAAAVAAGAAGIVLDAQLALVKELERHVPAGVRAAIAAMDGSETRVLGGQRVFVRPDLPSAQLPDDIGAREVEELIERALRDGVQLRDGLLPLGQDAALAADLAARHNTAGGIVQAFQRAIDEQISLAAGSDALAPGSAFADRHSITFPIVQGPMTRVSDRAAFARHVADNGGLPFLALALLPGDEVRSLLTETAELLGDRPWGVGILGFVPPAIRDEQLAVVHEVGPPAALIAGGRPSQAAPLEQVGIATFLHVPSPGLLDRFVKDGARRFVFEGRECGGHVGPRPSFLLWEQQVQRLLAYADRGGTDGKGSLDGIEVLFAGGVHDERSAAMVSVLAAPLVDRSVAIGVLMGTAYLFTEEAVAGAAIQPAFQDEALGCRRTVLLETAPGHATRCVETQYVRAFSAEKERLIAEGAGNQELWAELEQLNLGRLRIASKGLRRDDDGLAEVDESTQRREGMYMIGDVATMRHDRTTIAALHEQVSAGSTAFLAARAAALGLGSAGDAGHTGAASPAACPVDVAIVGMSCFLPGATDADEFWTNVVAGVDSVTEVPAERWDADRYYDENAFTQNAGVKTPSKWGGFLPDIDFDALAYGIPPKSLASIEPVQLLALEVAARALADAGYADREFDRSRASVIFGAEAGTDLSSAYGFRSLLPQYAGSMPDALDEFLPKLTEDSFPGLLTNVIAGRIANRLDLGGVNYTVDAACAASLAAVDLACKELVSGSSDVVLCGGADLHNGINDFLLFASVHALSPSGRCRTFDESADGIALGEGVACVVLKRLEDAERDGDRIYAVVKSIAGSSDGRHLGLTAPRQEGQRRALERAYDRAGISPAEVGMVEAHGTGTVVGDRTELATLTDLFEERGAEPASCALGSVKSNIGHTKCAAGLAGLIKAANAVWRGVRPPTLHVEQPNQAYTGDQSPFLIYDRSRPWTSERRIAGVSAFGFGGTNFHAVLSSYDGDDPPAHGTDVWPVELFVFRGADREAAKALLELVQEHLDVTVPAGTAPRLRDLAATVASIGASEPVQVAVIADSVADLRAKLPSAIAFEPERGGVFVARDELDGAAGDGAAGEVAFLFPGQGSQRPGMLADLFVAFPALQDHLRAGAKWVDAMLPPAAFTKDGAAAQQAALTDTRVAQPALGIAGLAMADLLGRAGVRPAMAAGHSYGELVALAVAGALSPGDLLSLSERRGEAILAAAGDDPGTMAAVAGAPADVEDVVSGEPGCRRVVVANRNSPAQAVLSGPTAEIDLACEQLTARGFSVKRIPVACAFHSSVVSGASDALAEALDAIDIGSPSIPVWANTTASQYGNDPVTIRSTLARQVAMPVRWVEQIEAMYDAGARIFVEAGPGRVLTQLVKKILGDRPHAVVACDASGDHGVHRFLQALAELATNGVDVDTGVLFDGRGDVIDLAADPPVAPAWVVNGHLVRTRDGAVVPGGLQPATAVPAVALGSSPVGEAHPSEVDSTVTEYLRGMREMVATQREVMLRYLGGPVPTSGSLEAVPLGTVPPSHGDRTVIEGSAVDVTSVRPVERAALTADQLLAEVLGIVADRTGYPLDMLDPDLDLEADLSIDSIKRIEILGELADQVGLPGATDDSIDESVVEELAQIKTIRGIVDWIVAAGDDDLTGSPDTEGSDPRAAADDGGAVRPLPVPVPVPSEALSFLPRLVDVPAARRDAAPERTLDGKRFVIVDDGRGVALHLATLLEERGASALIQAPGAPWPGAESGAALDGLIELSALAPGSRVTAVEVFPIVRAAAVGGAGSIIVASGMGGGLGHPVPGRDGTTHEGDGGAGVNLPPGAGVPGLCRTLAREFLDASVRAVDFEPKADHELVAGALLDELLLRGDPVAVGRLGARRCTIACERAADVVAGAELVLDPRSVVVLTGGARGITAKVAWRIAEQSGCRLALIGRSPVPEDEDLSTASAEGEAELRRALVDAGVRVPREVEAAVRRVLMDREIRANLAALDAVAASVTYHQADVRDRAQLASALDAILAEHGRVDVAVHGAGVLDDKLVRDKTAESFSNVFETKVLGACGLAAELLARRADGRPATLVLFGSIAGVFGNRGQVDYAAANDALDSLAWSLDGHDGLQVLAVDWGPWAGGGMVSAELEREYERRGVGLLDPDDATQRLLDLMRSGSATQAVVMRSTPAALGVDAGQPEPGAAP